MSSLQASQPSPVIAAGTDVSRYVTLRIDGQLFGIPVMLVHDVHKWQKTARIPLAPAAVVGAFSWRGRIVTAIDMRMRLGLASYDDIAKYMCVVVEHGGELYGLMVDAAEEMMALPSHEFAKTPDSISPQWRDIAEGAYRLDSEILVIIDIPNILRLV